MLLALAGLTSAAWAQNSTSEVVEYEVIPLIKEYWFDDLTNVRKWSSNLRNAIK